MTQDDHDAIEAYLAEHGAERLPAGAARGCRSDREQRQFSDLRTVQNGRRIPPRPTGYHYRR